jgi:hypothetical protein
MIYDIIDHMYEKPFSISTRQFLTSAEDDNVATHIGHLSVECSLGRWALGADR